MNTLLILDRHSVASASSDVSFHLNPAQKHPENPVMLPGEPQEWDSLQVTWPGTVLYDAAEGLFRCWYHGADAVQQGRGSGPQVWAPGYAESPDGVHWSKPTRAEAVHRGRPSNRILTDWGGVTLGFVMPNPDPQDRARRFLSFWKTTDSWTTPQLPRALASSADGVHWTLESRCVYREPAPRNQMQDFWQVLYQPDAVDADFRYLAYSQYWSPRAWDQKLVRQIGLHHGRDLASLRDAETPVVLSPEQGIDEELHFASVTRAGGKYLMFFESDRFSCKPLNGDVRLAVSDDGRSFRRVHPSSAVIPTGPKGTWDENMIVTTNYLTQEVGDELWLFYFGCPNVYRNWPGGYDRDGLKGSLFYPSYLGIATLPRDRFGYALGPGRVRVGTPGLDLREALWVNCDGGVQVRALDAGGQELARGGPGDLRHQSVYRRVHWDRTSTGKSAAALECQLDAETRLYGLRI